jgi:hypothetical protein
MKTLYQDSRTTVEVRSQAPVDTEAVAPTNDTIPPRDHSDACRDVLLAVQRALAANWEEVHPRVAVVDRNGLDTVYVSSAIRLGPPIRADIRGAVRAALAPYAKLAPFTNVIFLTRGNP